MTSWNEMSRKEQLLCTFSDVYKDAYGFRPRGRNMSEMTEREIELELNHLEEVIRINEARREQEEQQSIDRFEQVVQTTIDAGAKDRETALRWIMTASEACGDWEYLCHLEGLPYGYFSKKAA